MGGFFNRHDHEKEVASDTTSQQVSNTGNANRKALQNTEHQMEFVAKINGIDYINDSAATSLDKTWESIASVDRQVVWITGTGDNSTDYNMMAELVRDKVRAIISIGRQKNYKLIQSCHRLVSCIVDAQNIEEAVHAAYCTGAKGDIVLFSPGCGSYDMFENYKERGRQYKSVVKAIYTGLIGS